MQQLVPLAAHYSRPNNTQGEPRRALVFTYLFGGCFVLLGSLDVVAPLLSMCFLLCYASMNITCFVLDILKVRAPRPRPRPRPQP